MKKRFFIVLAFLLFFESASARVRNPETEIKISPNSPPIQKVAPGSKDIAVLKFLITGKNHAGGEFKITSIKIKHKGDFLEQFQKYELLVGKRIVGKSMFSNKNAIEFGNLEFIIKDGETKEVSMEVDIRNGDFFGEHQFIIEAPESIIIAKETAISGESNIKGDFPIQSYPLLIGHEAVKNNTPKCRLQEDPVCGEDGRTYFNMCIPFYKKINILHKGSCSVEEQKEEFLSPCPRIYVPVCGTDEKTYDNECIFLREKEKKNIEKKYNGACIPKESESSELFKQAINFFFKRKEEIQNEKNKNLSPASEKRLEEISGSLRDYRFTPRGEKILIEAINNFLEFTKISKTGTERDKEIALLNDKIIEAKKISAEEKLSLEKIPYLDVDEDSWFLEFVKFFKDKNWDSGFFSPEFDEDIESKNEGYFRPGDFLSKAQFTKILFDMTGINEKNAPLSKNPFAKNHWSRKIIGKAEEMDLSLWKGYPNPDKRVSRSEAIKTIFEVLNINTKDKYLWASFSDVKKEHPAFEDIEFAKQRNIIEGYKDGTFRPNETIRKVEVAKILKKTYDYFIK